MEGSSGAKRTAFSTTGGSSTPPPRDAKETRPAGQTGDGRQVLELRADEAQASSGLAGSTAWGSAPSHDAINDMVEGRGDTRLLDRCRQILTATLSAESLDGALAIEQLLRQSNALATPVTQIAKEGRFLSAEFITSGARNQVNITATLRGQYAEALVNLEALRPGDDPAMALAAFRNVLGAIKTELTSVMQKNLAMRWHGQASLPAAGSPPDSRTPGSPAATTGRPGAAKEASARSTPDAQSGTLAASIGLPEARMEAFESFLKQYNRVHYLDALEAAQDLTRQRRELSDADTRSKLATDAESFCNRFYGKSVVLTVSAGQHTEPEIRDAIRKIRSTVTLDPEGAAMNLEEQVQAAHDHVLAAVIRLKEGFEALGKARPDGKNSPPR